MSFIYREVGRPRTQTRFAVGYFEPGGDFYAACYFPDEDAAAAHCSYLNGGRLPQVDDDIGRVMDALAGAADRVASPAVEPVRCVAGDGCEKIALYCAEHAAKPAQTDMVGAARAMLSQAKAARAQIAALYIVPGAEPDAAAAQASVLESIDAAIRSAEAVLA